YKAIRIPHDQRQVLYLPRFNQVADLRCLQIDRRKFAAANLYFLGSGPWFKANVRSERLINGQNNVLNSECLKPGFVSRDLICAHRQIGDGISAAVAAGRCPDDISAQVPCLDLRTNNHCSTTVRNRSVYGSSLRKRRSSEKKNCQRAPPHRSHYRRYTCATLHEFLQIENGCLPKLAQ